MTFCSIRKTPTTTRAEAIAARNIRHAVLDALLDAMLTAWLQGDHVLEIEAAQLLRLAPFCLCGFALLALAHAWLIDTHDALLPH